MAVANEVWMLENAIYSILSPEGFASILWKDSKKAPDAARVMKITAADLYERGLIEHVIPEPEPASIETMPQLAENMRQGMTAFFERLQWEEQRGNPRVPLPEIPEYVNGCKGQNRVRDSRWLVRADPRRSA